MRDSITVPASYLYTIHMHGCPMSNGCVMGQCRQITQPSYGGSATVKHQTRIFVGSRISCHAVLIYDILNSAKPCHACVHRLFFSRRRIGPKRRQNGSGRSPSSTPSPSPPRPRAIIVPQASASITAVNEA